ncbi:hypothetical protein ACFSQP_09040 [Bizionia sediminis]|uniref:Anti-sigma factor n=1 Tax=Bizionia sediminis TaxID=1737064 RepID=A0ABW5KVG1_9FLAO
MKANEFENNIRKTLEARKTPPSATAWNQLATALDKQNKKPSKSPYWFAGIAASVIGLLMVLATFWPSKNTETTTKPTVVETSADSILKIESKTETTKNVANSEDENKGVVEAIPTNSSVNKHISEKQKVSAKPYASLDENEARELAGTNANVVEKILEEVKQISNNNTRKNTIAQNKDSNVLVDSDLDAEVAALLKQATNRISKNSDSEETNYGNNANSLLAEIEMDLEKSFRDKVFETIKTNFSILKNAVVDRNN